MGAGKIDKDLVYKVIYGNLENNSHIRTGQYLFLYSYCSALWRNNRTISLWKRHSKNARFDNRCHEKSDFHMKVAELVAAADSWYFFFLRTSRFLIFFLAKLTCAEIFFLFLGNVEPTMGPWLFWRHIFCFYNFARYLFFYQSMKSLENISCNPLKCDFKLWNVTSKIFWNNCGTCSVKSVQ